jgi:hypothetical protein
MDSNGGPRSALDPSAAQSALDEFNCKQRTSLCWEWELAWGQRVRISGDMPDVA